MNSPGQRVFRKRMPRGGAIAEEFGWRQLSGRLQTPLLHARVPVDQAQDELLYEDVFASGRARHLLGDLISAADDDPTTVGAVTALVDAVCDDLVAAVATSGRTAALAECVPGLYADRIRPGGRIDTWWLDDTFVLATADGPGLVAVRDLAGYTVTANGTRLSLEVPAAIRSARTGLDPAGRWSTALTQGDPTEPNIADSAAGGACWLDFEYAGRNTVAGEISNLLWYLLALGGWLVPLHQRDTYVRTLRLHLPPAATPRIRHTEVSTRHRHLDIDYTWPTGPGRRAALTRLLTRLAGDLGAAAGLPTGRELEALRPFLTTRILGVIPPGRLGTDELLLVLAKLAEIQTAADQFTRTDPLPAPSLLERS
ncbi:hypothetical protein [Kitasatospora phosalacinea]|uniref:Uncharacterized protein n=1 Tax=Kitasatospora phosalacinea TaxID=2065 RepID=A0A9W6PPW4_9ACTN|nr:hypothetical protein [Kitasatospora phosalacinea]GLW58741.1 hypothetical protein Kpho01_67520 [Kitasatospora phosalacinea]